MPERAQGNRHRPSESSAVQFNLKLILAGIALFSGYLTLVRISDFVSATLFVMMMAWLLSPVWLTFAVLYREVTVGRRPRGNTNRKANE